MAFTLPNPFRRQAARTQHLLTVNDGEATSVTYKGNSYTSYSSAVDELAKKYDGTAVWGVQITRNLIDVRAAFILAGGISAVVEQENEREADFIKAFMEHNDLDKEVPKQWAREAEIEGKFLVGLYWNDEAKKVDIRFIPWSTNQYSVKTPDNDYLDYQKVTYYSKGKAYTLEPDSFVYKRFAGRTHKVNETMPKVGVVLTAIEAIDKALRDWREINRFFTPTPVIVAESRADAENIENHLMAINWKLGRMLILANATYELKGLDASAIGPIENEILTNAKIISGTTGVPIHFLGFAEMMSNRATAENLLEMVQASTDTERTIWTGFYENLFRKAVQIWNVRMRSNLRPEVVGAKIAELTAAKLKEVNDVWLPLYLSGVIQLETLLGKLPEVDVQEEMARREKNEPQFPTAPIPVREEETSEGEEA